MDFLAEEGLKNNSWIVHPLYKNMRTSPFNYGSGEKVMLAISGLRV
jgi:hypothetical protein